MLKFLNKKLLMKEFYAHGWRVAFLIKLDVTGKVKAQKVKKNSLKEGKMSVCLEHIWSTLLW